MQLVEQMRVRGFTLLAVQYLHNHTEWMAAVEIPRKQYLARLREAVMIPTTFT